jgi:hypothetical protein
VEHQAAPARRAPAVGLPRHDAAAAAAQEIFEGGDLMYGAGLRLRHLASGQYLAVRNVREEEAVALSHERVAQTVLVPVRVRGDSADRRLVSDSLVYLQASAAALYLHARDELGDGLDTRAPLLICGSRTLHPQDGFRLVPMRSHRVDNARHTLSIRGALAMYQSLLARQERSEELLLARSLYQHRCRHPPRRRCAEAGAR